MSDLPSTHLKTQLSKINVAFFAGLHLAACLAFFPQFFSWAAVGVFFFLYWLTASLGICLGFHRYLTHKSFELPKYVGYFFALCGTLACQNGPNKWVAQHRMHHAHSDTPMDPHSMQYGFLWAHFSWMIYKNHYDDPQKIIAHSKDLQSDPFYRFLDNNFLKLQGVLAVILYAMGGWSFVIWGVFVRLVVAYHSTWFVNSAAHTFGYRNVKLKDDLSTNCWWVGLLAWGEGWHNNHHAFPSSAKHGLRPWEIDCTWIAIWVLKTLGLAKNIKVAELQRDVDQDEKYFSGVIVKKAA